jgi:Mrp family chromosome partitioning ATPase
MIRDTGKPASHGPATVSRRSDSDSIAEYYHALLRNLRFHIHENVNRPQAIGITSVPGCGLASVVATNLAICLAHADARQVILINADPRNRIPESTFSLDANLGIYDALRGQCSAQETIQETDIPKLKVVGCGQLERGFEPFNCLMKFGEVLNEFKEDQSIIILNLPQASELTPCFNMASCLDGVVLEVESSSVKRDVALRTLEQLRFANANVLGCVFKQS